MPTNTKIKVGIGFEGEAVGITTSPNLTALLGPTTVLTSTTGTGKQVFARWSVPITLATTATTTLNLISGLSNPLGETIAGASMAFSQVLAFVVQNFTASPGTAAVEVFGGTIGSQFQGDLGVTCSVALLPGQAHGFNVESTTAGWAVNATACQVQLRNLGTTVASMGVLIVGTV